MDKRRAARITGWSLIFMALVAAFSIGFAYSEIYKSEHVSSLKDNLGLNKLMLVGILVILILDVVVSWSLFSFFKHDSKKI